MVAQKWLFKIVLIWVKCREPIKWGFRHYMNKATERRRYWLRIHRIAGSLVQWRKLVCMLIIRLSNWTRLAVVGWNPHIRTQISRMLRNSFVPKKDKAASTSAPMRLTLNSIPVTDQSVVLRRKISNVWIMLLSYMLVRTFLNARKLLGGIPATPIILRQCSTIKRC